MLDGKCAFNTLADKDLIIHWGAYLGTPDEIVVSGRLGDVGADIERIREEARGKKGWIMDTYLLRKAGEDGCTAGAGLPNGADAAGSRWRR